MRSAHRFLVVRLLTVLFAVVATLVATSASAMELDALLSRVEAKYGDVASIRAGFTQITRSQMFGEERQEGELLLKRPSRMRWTFGDDKVFVTDGRQMWVYSKADRQVVYYEDISGSTSATDNLLQSLDKLREHFKVTLVSSDDATSHVLDLEPLTPGQFKKVRLQLDAELTLTSVAITDAFDSVTELNFRDVRLNPDIDDARFTFEVPEGVEVIRTQP